MAAIDGGTLASQKELKCQINSVRAPDAQEFLYLASWEAHKGRLCVSEQPGLNTAAFLLLSTSSSSSSYCRLNGGAGTIHPPPPFGPAVSASARRRVHRGRLLSHQSRFTAALVFTSAAENTEATVGVLTGMSALTDRHVILLWRTAAQKHASVFTFQRRARWK